MQILNFDFSTSELDGVVLKDGQLLFLASRAVRVYSSSVLAGWSSLNDHSISFRYFCLHGQRHYRG